MYGGRLQRYCGAVDLGEVWEGWAAAWVGVGGGRGGGGEVVGVMVVSGLGMACVLNGGGWQGQGGAGLRQRGGAAWGEP